MQNRLKGLKNLVDEVIKTLKDFLNRQKVAFDEDLLLLSCATPKGVLKAVLPIGPWKEELGQLARQRAAEIAKNQQVTFNSEGITPFTGESAKLVRTVQISQFQMDDAIVGPSVVGSNNTRAAVVVSKEVTGEAGSHIVSATVQAVDDGEAEIEGTINTLTLGFSFTFSVEAEAKVPLCTAKVRIDVKDEFALKATAEKKLIGLGPAKASVSNYSACELTVSTSGEGEVTSVPPGIDCPTREKCRASFQSTQDVILTAAARSGSRFERWFSNCSAAGTNPFATVRMDGNKACEARFTEAGEPTLYRLSVAKIGAGKGSVISVPQH